MKKSIQHLAVVMGLGLVLPISAAPTPEIGASASEAVGGKTTVYATGKNAFSFPLANLDDAERTRFAIGNSFFKRNWVEVGASTTARDGLGPHFIARSCGGCHVMDGRGAPPKITNKVTGEHGPTVELLIRLSIPGHDRKAGVIAEPTYGDQFNNAAVQGVKPEGRVQIQYTAIQGQFADGTPYTLQKPQYKLTDLAYGPLHPETMIGPRIAPHLAGVGLLEAISVKDILQNAADQKAAGGSIAGKPNRVYDVYARSMRIGRLGWKANVASIVHQTAGAFNGDIGITSRLFPKEACMPRQADCLAAPHGGGRSNSVAARHASRDNPEIDNKTLSDVVFYQATLAPAARRTPKDPKVMLGEKLFHAAQCATCHRPSYVTTGSPFPEFGSPKLKGQLIWPYTDLLLHDMGEDLADGRADFQATGRQWKTPALWGIGLIKEVNGHQRLLHDGRANGVLEAILWHGGEAQASKESVLKMKASEREALVQFVESL
jgi:CxxC motif-containing protein (DUF1111 family)